MEALKKRHDEFHEVGCRLSDHGLPYAYSSFCSKDEAENIFTSALNGKDATGEQQDMFASFLMDFFGELNAEKGWTMQLHLGPMRNNNSQLFQSLGPDIGFDSIGDTPQGESLSHFLDKLNLKNKLPKTILYNINPRDNYLMATMIGNFQDGSIPGKIQFGSGWWFLDQKEGMQMQLNALSNCGLLSRFVGMRIGNKADATEAREYVEWLRAAVAAEMNAGKTADEVVATLDTSAYKDWAAYDMWGKLNIEGMARWLKESGEVQ